MENKIDPKDLIFKDAHEVKHFVQGAYAIIDGVEQRIGERHIFVSSPTDKHGNPETDRAYLFFGRPQLPNPQGHIVPVYVPIEGVSCLSDAWDKYDDACQTYVEKVEEMKKQIEANAKKMAESPVMGEIKKEN